MLHGGALPFDAPWARWVTLAAALVLLAGLALRLAWYGFVPVPPPFPETTWIVGKEDLACPALLHAWALAWLVAALVPRDAPWMHRGCPPRMAAIGRYSLEVFCLGLFLSWGGTTIAAPRPRPSLARPAADRHRRRPAGLFAHWLQRRRTPALVAPA